MSSGKPLDLGIWGKALIRTALAMLAPAALAACSSGSSAQPGDESAGTSADRQSGGQNAGVAALGATSAQAADVSNLSPDQAIITRAQQIYADAGLMPDGGAYPITPVPQAARYLVDECRSIARTDPRHCECTVGDSLANGASPNALSDFFKGNVRGFDERRTVVRLQNQCFVRAAADDNVQRLNAARRREEARMVALDAKPGGVLDACHKKLGLDDAKCQCIIKRAVESRPDRLIELFNGDVSHATPGVVIVYNQIVEDCAGWSPNLTGGGGKM